MFTRTRGFHSLATATLALAAMKTWATTPPPPQPVQFDGRYYQVVIANKITWQAAKLAAEQRELDVGGGIKVKGHLATIGSLDEDLFLHQLRQNTLNAPHAPITGSELWVGGFQEPCTTVNPPPEPGCGWVWLNGEAIAGQNSASPYTHWLNGEPNNLIRTPNADNLAAENFLAIGLGGAFGWNDEGALANVWGYIIEYGDKVTVPATSCTADGPGCNPTGAQIQTFPPSAQVAEDATLTARTFVIHDNPSRCGVEPLVLFDGAAILPPYLCGHPDFLVIETETTGVQIQQGVIDVENLTADVLPGNLYACSSTTDPDVSHRDVVGWQSADRADMLESSLGTGRFQGAVTEVTFACGSSRGRVLSGSFHFVGLRIHPGAAADGNAQLTRKSMAELTRYKLQVLQASVVASKTALPRLQFAILKGLVDVAIAFHDRAQYRLALLNIRLFLAAVAHANYAVVPGKNFNGDHVMRGSNIEFMYTAKIVPIGP
jgi:hypothetical protein